MALRQGDQLVTSAYQEGIAGNDQRSNFILDDCGEGGIYACLGAGPKNQDFLF